MASCTSEMFLDSVNFSNLIDTILVLTHNHLCDSFYIRKSQILKVESEKDNNEFLRDARVWQNREKFW